MGFCLPTEGANKFIQALKSGDIDPTKLSDMTSEERRDYFADIVGTRDAQEVNAAFESKLLLKNQQTGMINWAKSVTGIKEPVRRDMIAKIERMTQVLTPESEKAFLGDLAEKRLGTDITFDEAGQLAQMSKELTDARAAIPKDSPDGSDERLDYGAKLVATNKFVTDLKTSNDETTLEEFKSKPIQSTVEVAKQLGGFAKSMKAIGDVSSLLRQGGKVAFTDPKIWATNAVKSMVDVGRQMKKAGTDNSIMDAVQADVQSRQNAMNGNYKKMGIDIGNVEIGNVEEALPSSLPEKIPLFGRLFKSTQVGFTSFLYRTRADLADQFITVAQKSGVDLSDEKQLPAIGKMVNSMTGRGSFGKFNKESDIINSVFFSPRFIKSNIDFLTAHALQKDVTPFVRKQAAMNLGKYLLGMTAIYAISSLINPKSVTNDPTNSNFGKVKIGPIAFDFTAGSGTIATLVGRLVEDKTTSPTTGKVTQLNTGKFGAPTSVSVIEDFLTNKEAPLASVITDYLQGQNYAGDKFGKFPSDILNPKAAKLEVQNGLNPFPVDNVMQATPDVGLANAIAAEMLDALGAYETLPYKKPTK